MRACVPARDELASACLKRLPDSLARIHGFLLVGVLGKSSPIGRAVCQAARRRGAVSTGALIRNARQTDAVQVQPPRLRLENILIFRRIHTPRVRDGMGDFTAGLGLGWPPLACRKLQGPHGHGWDWRRRLRWPALGQRQPSEISDTGRTAPVQFNVKPTPASACSPFRWSL
jgi:hypothetical protein